MAQGTVKTLPVLVGALAMGLLGMTGVGAYFAATGGAKGSGNDQVFLLVIAVLGPAEFIAYRLGVAPALMKQAAATAKSGSADMDQRLEGQFVVKTILAAALAEGWGLFGAMILFLTGQWAAIAAPLIALAVLAPMIDASGRFERFKEEAAREV